MTIMKRRPRIEPMIDDENRLPKIDMDRLEADMDRVEAEIGPSTPDANVEALAFAPISERLESTGKLMGQGIRQAVEATAKQVQGACADVLTLAQQIVADGDKFAESLREIGEAHAQRIAKATADMQKLVAVMAAERKRFNGDDEDESKPQ